MAKARGVVISGDFVGKELVIKDKKVQIKRYEDLYYPLDPTNVSSIRTMPPVYSPIDEKSPSRLLAGLVFGFFLNLYDLLKVFSVNIYNYFSDEMTEEVEIFFHNGFQSVIRLNGKMYRTLWKTN